METLHFTGKFKDLIPNGWTFHKLFAGNYRCYWFSLADIEMPGEDIIIWGAKRYIQLPKLFEEASAALMRYVLKGVEFVEYSDHVKEKLGFKGLAPTSLIYNKTTNTFRLKKRGDIMMDYLFDTLPKPTDDEIDQWRKDHEHLQEYILTPEFYDLITKWFAEGMFEFKP